MELSEILTIVFTWQNLLALVAASFYGLLVGLLPGSVRARDGPGVSSRNELAAGDRPDLFRHAAPLQQLRGSITAIMLNTPATSELRDHPGRISMCENGKSAVALGLSATSAVVGGIIGIVVLILFSPLLAELALKFGPAEYFLVSVFALSIISSLVKEMHSGAGICRAWTGAGHLRVRFGHLSETIHLRTGIPGRRHSFTQVLVGLFAISQALSLSETNLTISKVGKLAGSFWEGFKSYFKYPVTIIRSTLIGLWLGVLPAVGGSTAVVMAYGRCRSFLPNTRRPSARETPRVSLLRRPRQCLCPGRPCLHDCPGIPGSIGRRCS